MTFPTVTETTPRPEAVTPDAFFAPALTDGPARRAREAAAVVPFLEVLDTASPSRG